MIGKSSGAHKTRLCHFNSLLIESNGKFLRPFWQFSSNFCGRFGHFWHHRMLFTHHKQVCEYGEIFSDSNFDFDSI